MAKLLDADTQAKAKRILSRQRRKAVAVGEHADLQVERLVLKRFVRLVRVRRFVVLWTVLLVMMGAGALWQVRTMDRFYLEFAATEGGIYREGVIGTFTNANPLFATSSVDATVSRLLFDGLFAVSPNGNVTPDLAKSYEVNDTGSVYTVNLRNDVMWHDGEQFDADDVVFTYELIQDGRVRSPLRTSWDGVKISKTNQTTVVFELPNPLSSFASSMTNGIVPEHVLNDIPYEGLRSSRFNTIEPVGTGPYRLSKLQVVGTEDINQRQEQIALTSNDTYFGQRQSLSGIVISTYRDEEAMQEDFDDQIIQSMVGLTSITDELAAREGVEVLASPLTSSVMVFLNTSNDILQDVKVRQALVRATNTVDIRNSIGFIPVPTDSPLLRSQFAYNPELTQAGYDIDAANRLLDEAGWQEKDEDGIRIKEDKKLKLRFVSQSLSEYAAITQTIQSEWRLVGVEVDAVLQPEEDVQAIALGLHEYDVLLYGISIGYDPDVFAYWHSSQADPLTSSGLNLSEYKSDIVDEALEAGRTRVDKDLRKVKYEPFLKAWSEDAPAIALYQPRFIMVVQGTFEGYEQGQLRTATDRFWSVANWKIRNTQIVKQ